MQQALWNLCPFSTAYSSACYYTADKTFTQLSGTSSNAVLDAPDGVWTLDVKRDIFDKVRIDPHRPLSFIPMCPAEPIPPPPPPSVALHLW